MQRRTFLSQLMMITAAIVAMIFSVGTARNVAAHEAGAGKAAAPPSITLCAGGSYTVDLTAIPASMWDCLAAAGVDGVRTSWGGVIWPSAGSPPYPGPGVYTEFPSVSVGTPLNYIDIFGTIITPTAGSTPPFISQTSVNTPCGPFCVVLCYDAMNCLSIKVYPGPCPAAPLPC